MQVDASTVTTLLLVGAVAVPLLAGFFPGLFMSDVLLGVDLGTTFSVVATCSGGNVTVIQIDGQPTLPSVVYFNKSDQEGLKEYIVGEQASRLRDVYPEQTVYDSKRLIGREFKDPVVQEEMKELMYAIEDDGAGYPVAVIHNQQIAPAEVGSIILNRLKQAAEDSQEYLRRTMGFKFKSLTVSIPVGFDADQREATDRAAKDAGFFQVRLLEEPVAAAIAYDLHTQEGEQLVTVFDFGGGTLDVAVLRLDPDDKTFFIMGTAGDSHLGGQDFDRAIASHYLKLLAQDLGLSKEQQHSLIPWMDHAAERGKRDLSDSEYTYLQLDENAVQDEIPKILQQVWNPIQSQLKQGEGYKLTRSSLKTICAELLDRTEQPMHKVLDDLNMKAEDITQIVMVGGSSRLLAVQERVSQFFGGRDLNVEIDPDTAIAIGAARSFGCQEHVVQGIGEHIFRLIEQIYVRFTQGNQQQRAGGGEAK